MLDGSFRCLNATKNTMKHQNTRLMIRSINLFLEKCQSLNDIC